MIRRWLIIEEARRWLGTTYRHQHRALGVGVDCIGLVWGVGEACGELWVDPEASRQYLAYSRHPNPRRLLAALSQFWEPVEGEPMMGDIPLMCWDNDHAIPQHMGILGADKRGRQTLIHAESRIGRCVEHGLSGEWPSRVHSWWRYPGLA